MGYLKDFCQTLGLVLRLRVDFVLPLSQQQQQQEQEEQPLTKIYQKGVYKKVEIWQIDYNLGQLDLAERGKIS